MLMAIRDWFKYVSGPEEGPGSRVDPELYKFFEYEIQFQRARKQEIFAWASSLLVAIIGGVIALTLINNIPLEPYQKKALIAAILILCASSCMWIHVHWVGYLRVRDRLSYYYRRLSPDGSDEYWWYD